MMLSIIILCYNFSDYIEKCLDSVISQKTNFEFEILVCDDFSTDNSLEILTLKYSGIANLKILANQKNLGAKSTLEILLENSKGTYVSCLDGDDFFSDEYKSQKQVDFLEANSDYVMHSTGYFAISPEGKILPEGSFFIPLRSEVETEDLLCSNLVTFGRTFRNVKGILKPWMDDFPMLDWAFNFQISLFGKIRCENWPSGFYRISESGMFSMKSEKEKAQSNNYCMKILQNQVKKIPKKITIIDCYVRNNRIEHKLNKTIGDLKRRGEEILLISNLPPGNDTIKKCDFFIFDSKNRLLKGEYTNVKQVDFHITVGDFTIHNLKPGLQRHCLSVLVNLYNSLVFARNLGYEYFQRIEVDDLYGEESLSAMSGIFHECLENNKLGCFFFNEPDKNVSFHYFLSEIDFFLSRLPKLEKEEDFQKYLIDTQNNLDFVIAEELLYNEIVSQRNFLISKDGGKMSEYFPDTVWNTETSGSNLDSKYENCVSGVYNLIDNGVFKGLIALSYNYKDSPSERKIVCFGKNGFVIDFMHRLDFLGAWSYNHIPEECERIEVFEGGEFLYSEKTHGAISYINY